MARLPASRRARSSAIVTPGQACSYKLGHSVFVDLRDRARAKRGPRLRIQDFPEAVLAPGRVPLDILRAVGERWIAPTERFRSI